METNCLVPFFVIRKGGRVGKGRGWTGTTPVSPSSPKGMALTGVSCGNKGFRGYLPTRQIAPADVEVCRIPSTGIMAEENPRSFSHVRIFLAYFLKTKEDPVSCIFLHNRHAVRIACENSFDIIFADRVVLIRYKEAHVCYKKKQKNLAFISVLVVLFMKVIIQYCRYPY